MTGKNTQFAFWEKLVIFNNKLIYQLVYDFICPILDSEEKAVRKAQKAVATSDLLSDNPGECNEHRQKRLRMPHPKFTPSNSPSKSIDDDNVNNENNPPVAQSSLPPTNTKLAVSLDIFTTTILCCHA
jgi:hypothetical protein